MVAFGDRGSRTSEECIEYGKDLRRSCYYQAPAFAIGLDDLVVAVHGVVRMTYARGVMQFNWISDQAVVS